MKYTLYNNYLYKYKKLILLLFFLLAQVSGNCLAMQDVVIGVRAHSGVEQAMQRWQPTIDYLQQKMQVRHTRLSLKRESLHIPLDIQRPCTFSSQV